MARRRRNQGTLAADNAHIFADRNRTHPRPAAQSAVQNPFTTTRHGAIAVQRQEQTEQMSLRCALTQEVTWECARLIDEC